ncbi:hypothetical protein BST81_11915 [Leptolyngbya sp. 'hensonii']|uniref:hypothetical protein n=1 Tax=Leptolyngbya sp. 'hensonii' TaxID=1922337 RepID=UPI00094FB15B|nr:hypothetical protein [Leptolyngbya sp. 'hensonii']OLP17775.1 hypothetical protein BST81_11915 [Leptolyngbya sp. 'hensonii']
MNKQRDRFRPVNPMLGVQPRLGPFPAEHILPWSVIGFAAYLLCQVFLNLGWLWTGVIAAWGISTWWILTGDKPWRFLSRFTRTPYWVRGYCTYHSILQTHRSHRHESKVRHKNRSHRAAAGQARSHRR